MSSQILFSQKITFNIDQKIELFLQMKAITAEIKRESFLKLS